MSEVAETVFTPSYQLDESAEVKVTFTLRPLNFLDFGRLQANISANGGNQPDFDYARQVFASHVLNWTGLEVPYSSKAVRQFVTDDTFPVEFATRFVWMGEVCGHLYVKGLLSKGEAKN